MRIFSALMILFLFLSSCEKPQLSAADEDGKVPPVDNTVGDKGAGGHADDHGGWNESNPFYGKEYQNGDTVNVRKFIDSDFDGEVWVKGYVIGCATGSGGYKYQLSSPFDYETAILLGDSRWNRSLSYAVSIQLTSGSKIRKELNLKSNSSLNGVMIAVKGEKTTYLKLPGMKKTSGYELKESMYGIKD